MNSTDNSYSENDLRQIESLAAIYIKPSDIAVIIGKPAEDFRADIQDPDSPAAIAYNKGKAASKVRLYAQEMKLAQAGSPLAVEITRRNLIEMEDDED